MYWEKDGVKLEPSSKYDVMVWEVQEHTKNLAVKVIALEPGDFGEYKCVAENPHGSDQASMHLYGEDLHVTFKKGLHGHLNNLCKLDKLCKSWTKIV